MIDEMYISTSCSREAYSASSDTAPNVSWRGMPPDPCWLTPYMNVSATH